MTVAVPSGRQVGVSAGVSEAEMPAGAAVCEEVGSGFSSVPPPGVHAAMKALSWVFADEQRYVRAQRLARAGTRPWAHQEVLRHFPGLKSWTDTRDLRPPAAQTFREWWATR